MHAPHSVKGGGVTLVGATKRAADLLAPRTPQEADEVAALAKYQQACKAKSDAEREAALREIGRLGFARRGTAAAAGHVATNIISA